MIDNIPASNHHLSPPVGSDRGVQIAERLLHVIATLSHQMERENADLAAGLPASIASDVERKVELADAFTKLWNELHDTAANSPSISSETSERLIRAALRLRDITDENLSRLNAAVNASRCRVEAVLAAARAEGRRHATYSANGEIPLEARLAAFDRDYHA